ncbi:MAG: hypothetical protein K1X74_21750 [Pirellulales bacterium]|nr:hypothetical protein [Pirellulales bacterium]
MSEDTIAEQPVHLTSEQLEAGLAAVLGSPSDGGLVRKIVRRPRTNEREVLLTGQLDVTQGLVGDAWSESKAHVDTQVTLMNARAAELICVTSDRWALAGDQLFVDLELSAANLPPGTRLSIGEATIVITAVPHNGCRKFSQRFGTAALAFVNSVQGKRLHLRGVYARVLEGGTVRVGDAIHKLAD